MQLQKTFRPDRLLTRANGQVLNAFLVEMHPIVETCFDLRLLAHGAEIAQLMQSVFIPIDSRQCSVHQRWLAATGDLIHGTVPGERKQCCVLLDHWLVLQ